MNTTIGKVAEASRDAGAAAVEVQESVEHMVGDLTTLRRQVDDFLGNLRTV
ncbi:hypothetical protein ACFQ4K_17575 [Tistrella bauzanensis]